MEKYQTDIIRNFRRVNSDYLEVGFYDCGFNRSMAQSMAQYQLSGVEESIALIYGNSPVRPTVLTANLPLSRSSIGYARLHQLESLPSDAGGAGESEE